VPFATVDGNHLGFTISSNTLAYSGTYNIWAVIFPQGANSVQPVKIPYQIKITTCGLQDFSAIYPYGDIYYEVGSGPIFLPPDLTWWTPSACTLTFTAVVDMNPGTIDQSLFSFDPQSGVFTINNSNPTTNNEIHFLALTVSDNAGHSYETNLLIFFFDPCSGSTLDSVPTPVTPVTHQIYSTTEVFTNTAVASMPCSDVAMSYSVPPSQSGILQYLNVVQDTNGIDTIKISVTSKSALSINNGVINLTVEIKSVSQADP